MEYKEREVSYNIISPGTMGVTQKISSGYRSGEIEGLKDEPSKLVFLAKNEVISCGQNQY